MSETKLTRKSSRGSHILKGDLLKEYCKLLPPVLNNYPLLRSSTQHIFLLKFVTSLNFN